MLRWSSRWLVSIVRKTVEQLMTLLYLYIGTRRCDEEGEWNDPYCIVSQTFYDIRNEVQSLIVLYTLIHCIAFISGIDPSRPEWWTRSSAYWSKWSRFLWIDDWAVSVLIWIGGWYLPRPTNNCILRWKDRGLFTWYKHIARGYSDLLCFNWSNSWELPKA